MKRWLCTVDRPSDRDHLFTGEGEGCEEPFERDGTTRQGRGAKRHAWRSGVHSVTVSGPDSSCGQNAMMEASNGKTKPGNGLRGCSGIAVISAFCECALKIHREAFATIETSLGKPCRVPKGHLKLVPRPQWSLGACRPVLGCRLLVSGSGPWGPVRKGARERSRVSWLKRDASGTRPDVSLVIATGVASLSNSSTFQNDGRGPSRNLRGSQSTGPGSLSAAPDSCSATSNSRGRTTGVFRRPFDTPPTPNVFGGTPSMSLTDESIDAPAPPTTHTAAAHPFTIPFPPPPAPTAVPLPSAAFLTSDQVMSVPPPVSMPAPTAVYTVPPPMVFPASSVPAPAHPQAVELPSYPPLQPHVNRPYQAPPPINTTFLEPGTPTRAAQFASSTHFLPEVDAEQERRLKRMEETIRALQANETRPDARYGDCSLFPGMRLSSKVKIPEFRTYEGTTDPRHHLRYYQGKMLQYWDYEEFVIHSFQDSLSGSTLDWFMSLKAEDIPTWADLSRKFIDQGVYYSHLLAHTSSFFDLIEAGKKLDLGIKLGRMEGPTVKGEESAKRTSAMSTSSSGKRGKEVSVNAVNPAHPTSQQYSINYAPLPFVVPAYTSPSAQQVPPPQGQPGGAVQSRPCRQYPSLPVPLSHIYQQLRASNKIGTISPGPNFDPTIQNRSKQCEYHRGALGHTLNNCWKLRERIHEMIDGKELTFNTVRSLNVQANPLPDHGPAQGPSINMISICALEEGESERSGPSPFVIEYIPTEATIGLAGIGISPTPFVIDIPAREPYSNDKNSAAADKGKAPAVEIEAIPRAPPTSPKKVTEEKVEAFMKIIKASEYKVVEQMAKSPAYISLLALLLSSEPHREALLRVLMAAQVPKGTPPNRIEEIVSSIFSSIISFSDDELPSERCAHSLALHIVCKCNNYVISRVIVSTPFWPTDS
ncbi:hypothetical protein CRG98_022323 [Punica granatum]|uniref:Retrotransposon gag domain-containing protein n=1 Tax=Punica granatum TaxID=22663 RepID=A0A2I0JLW7_PUNGR|nr:hypothetical protein CRG98_022323 [Punica granatum]